MSNSASEDPLATVVRVLKPLDSAERIRTIKAAMLYLGESTTETDDGAPAPAGTQPDSEFGEYPPRVVTWFKQYDVSPDALDRVFHFASDGTFDIHDAPGKSKKEKMINTYILTGLGTYLATGDRVFDDALARQFCSTIGCYDAANHATNLKSYRGAEFTGDKTRGLSITNPGIKKGAALVKGVAGDAT